MDFMPNVPFGDSDSDSDDDDEDPDDVIADVTDDVACCCCCCWDGDGEMMTVPGANFSSVADAKLEYRSGMRIDLRKGVAQRSCMRRIAAMRPSS